MSRLIAEQVTPALTHHGEGPVWDDVAGCLRWVDLLRGDVLSLQADGGVDRLHVGDVAAALRPRVGGGLVVAVERGFALVDPDGTVHRLPELWSDPTVRMNDGACDPQGRFYCGSMAYDEAPGRGALHRLDPDGTSEVVLADVTISNGLGWLAGGGAALYVDSPTQRVDLLDFDADSGRFGDRRPFATIEPGAGAPDGIALDADGGVWVALWGGGAVRRYDADGTLDAVVEIGVRNVTACALTGGDLFVTTSAVDDPDTASAGALFRIPVGVAGLTSGAFSA